MADDIIISSTIDANYPVAGVDNDTQGFRDNFQIIKTGLAAADSKLSELDSKTAKLDETNDFGGTNLLDANITQSTEQYHNIGTVANNQNISFLNGHYQILTINPSGDSITLTLADWPDRDGLAKLTVQVKTIADPGGADGPKTITWLSEGGGTIKAPSTFLSPFSLNSGDYAEDPGIVEFWTYDRGTTVYANWLGRFEAI